MPPPLFEDRGTPTCLDYFQGSVSTPTKLLLPSDFRM